MICKIFLNYIIDLGHLSTSILMDPGPFLTNQQCDVTKSSLDGVGGSECLKGSLGSATDWLCVLG